MIQSSTTPSLPTADQSQSRLLNLPTEVRQFILQQLLTSTTTISAPNRLRHRRQDFKKVRAFRRKGWKIPYRKYPVTVIGVNLDPQILRMCQQMLEEGFSTLYTTNALGMTIHDVDWFVNNYVAVQPAPSYHIRSLVIAGLSAEQSRLVSYFGAYEIHATMHGESFLSERLRRNLRLLRNSFAGKQIVLVAHGRLSNNVNDSSYAAGLLQAWRIIRCRSLTVKDSSVEARLLEDVVATATGDTQIVDLENAGTHLRKLYDQIGRPRDHNASRQVYTGIREAVEACDHAALEAVRAQVLQELDDWYQKHKRRILEAV
ncbi:hypothetical protein LTR66_017909 [Elasticomyces elasticus]|nr:hypothetical protein LTR66_017909 [Elasticomyces elasticus]